MRKQKSLVAILLAVMMIFTFMPTMAFAETSADGQHTWTWDPDYSGITIDGVHYSSTRTWDSANGTVHATPNTSGTAGAYVDPAMDVEYHDLSNAVFGTADYQLNVGWINVTPTSSTYLKNANYAHPTGLIFSCPDYVTAASKNTNVRFIQFGTGSTTTPCLNSGTWQGEVKGDEEYVAGSTDDQSFTLTVDVSYRTGTFGTERLFAGKVADLAVTVKGKDADPANALFFMDKVDEKATIQPALTAAYTGSNHTVVMKDLKGYTVKYTVFNKKTNEWDPVDAVTIKDVESLTFKATLYGSDGKVAKIGTADAVYTLNASVTAAGVRYAFDEDPTATEFDIPEGTEYNPADYVFAYAAKTSDVDTNKKAVAADQAELMAFFKDFAKFTTTIKKATPDIENVNYELNSDLTDAEVKALKTKYATLIKNYGLTSDALIGATIGTGTQTFTRVHPAADTEIEFTVAPSKVTYGGKNTTKKGVLKKNKTIAVAAVANNGAVIEYKLINAETSKIKINKNTGEITVKKGLKKGTYKFTVKAYTKDMKDFNGKAFFENQVIKIVVKK